MVNSWKEKYNALSLPMRATLWFAISQFAQKGISVLTTPFFTRLMPTEEYGIVCTFSSWQDIMLILIACSVYKGIMNLCVKHEDRDKILSSALGLSLVMGICWCCIFFLLENFLLKLTGLTPVLYWGLLVYCIFQNIFICWSVRMQYDYRYREIVAVTIIYALFTSVGGLVAVLYISNSANAKIFPQIIASAIIGIILLFNSFRKNKELYVKEIWKFCMGFTVPLLPHYLSEVILQSSDRIMINNLCGASDVAIYSIAYSVGNLIFIITSAVNSAFAPYQYQKIKAKEYDSLAKNTNIVIGFVAFCLCGIMLFGREVVLIFGGNKYIDSVPLIIPICLGVFFNYVFQLFARIQEYYEQKYTIVIASVSCAFLNIVLNFIFIKVYGYIAAAYTTFICYFVFCFLHYIFYRVACRKHVHREIYDIKGLLGISGGLIVAALVINAISGIYILKYILLGLAFVVFLTNKNKILKVV